MPYRLQPVESTFVDPFVPIPDLVPQSMRNYTVQSLQDHDRIMDIEDNLAAMYSQASSSVIPSNREDILNIVRSNQEEINNLSQDPTRARVSSIRELARRSAQQLHPYTSSYERYMNDLQSAREAGLPSEWYSRYMDRLDDHYRITPEQAEMGWTQNLPFSQGVPRYVNTREYIAPHINQFRASIEQRFAQDPSLGSLTRYITTEYGRNEIGEVVENLTREPALQSWIEFESRMSDKSVEEIKNDLKDYAIRMFARETVQVDPLGNTGGGGGGMGGAFGMGNRQLSTTRPLSVTGQTMRVPTEELSDEQIAANINAEEVTREYYQAFEQDRPGFEEVLRNLGLPENIISSTLDIDPNNTSTDWLKAPLKDLGFIGNIGAGFADMFNSFIGSITTPLSTDRGFTDTGNLNASQYRMLVGALPNVIKSEFRERYGETNSQSYIHAVLDYYKVASYVYEQKNAVNSAVDRAILERRTQLDESEYSTTTTSMSLRELPVSQGQVIERFQGARSDSDSVSMFTLDEDHNLRQVTKSKDKLEFANGEIGNIDLITPIGGRWFARIQVNTPNDNDEPNWQNVYTPIGEYDTSISSIAREMISEIDPMFSPYANAQPTNGDWFVAIAMEHTGIDATTAGGGITNRVTGLTDGESMLVGSYENFPDMYVRRSGPGYEFYIQDESGEEHLIGPDWAPDQSLVTNLREVLAMIGQYYYGTKPDYYNAMIPRMR